MRRYANICIGHKPELGGLYRAVNDFSRALSAPIISFTELRDVCLPPAPDLMTIPCGRGPLASRCYRLARAARERASEEVANVDALVVHSLFRPHTTWAAATATQSRKQYWAVPHGCLDPWGLRRRSVAKTIWMRTIGQSFLSKADVVIFSSQREMQKAAHLIPRAKMAVVPWPVSLPSGVDRTIARKRLRDMVDAPVDSLIALYVGRIHRMKRLPETIQAFCAVHRAPWHLVIAGMDGDTTLSQLRALIPDNLAGNVHLHGPIAGQKLIDAYAGSDAFVSLSFRENFGYAVADAAAYGLPLLISEGHDLAMEMPRASNDNLACGWLVPHEGESARNAAFTALFQSSENERVRLGHLGSEFVGSMLSFEKFRSTLLRLA